MYDPIPDIFHGLVDEVAVARGRRALRASIAMHERHRAARHCGVVGALALDVEDLGAVAALTDGAVERSLGITLGVHDPNRLAAVVAAAEAVPEVRLEAIAVDLPHEADVTSFVGAIHLALGGREVPFAVRVVGLSASRWQDGPSGLAVDLTTLVAAGVPVEVVGLNHAVAEHEAVPWAEQTGVLNVLLAADAALDGADVEEVQQILTISEGLTESVLLLDPRVRGSLRAVASARVHDIVDGLAGLGLLTEVRPDIAIG